MLTTSRIFLLVLIYFSKADNFCKANPLSGYTGPANQGEFAFVVSIGRRFDVRPPNIYGHTCGGALITEIHVLTSALCFLSDKKVQDYFVYFGSNDLSKSQLLEIQSWITYDEWAASGKGYRGNDIAVVTLAEKVYRRKPLTIPKLSKKSLAHFFGRYAVTAGWGVLFDDSVPQFLVKANLRIIDDHQCILAIWNKTSSFQYIHQSNVFCSVGATLFAVLDDGDRGSPIYAKNELGVLEVIGVNQNSWPPVNSIVELPDQKNLHTSVIYYKKFILDVTKRLWLYTHQ